MWIGATIPVQEYTVQAKLDFITGLNKMKIDDQDDQDTMWVLPQEYFGGDYIMPNRPSFRESDLRFELEDICNKKGFHLVVGVVEKEFGNVYQRAWVIDKDRGLVDKYTKAALPSYTAKSRGGYYGLTEETNLASRFRTT